MNATLLKALLAFVPAAMLFAGSVAWLVRVRTAGSFLQLLGAGGVMLVILAHICEALHVFPWMGWGLENSPGHYLDLSGALLGLTLFPIGYLLNAVSTRWIAHPG